MDRYVNLAKKSIEYYTYNRKIMDIPKDLPEEFYKIKAGCFVSLKKNGNLRGCIGTIIPTKENIAKEIISNSVSAAFNDTRFFPLRIDELNDIEYSVDILYKAEEIESIDDLDVDKYGIIVEKDFRKGLLLPNLEGVDTIECQIQIALNKAGISKDEDYSIKRFKVERHI